MSEYSDALEKASQASAAYNEYLSQKYANETELFQNWLQTVSSAEAIKGNESLGIKSLSDLQSEQSTLLGSITENDDSTKLSEIISEYLDLVYNSDTLVLKINDDYSIEIQNSDHEVWERVVELKSEIDKYREDYQSYSNSILIKSILDQFDLDDTTSEQEIYQDFLTSTDIEDQISSTNQSNIDKITNSIDSLISKVDESVKDDLNKIKELLSNSDNLNQSTFDEINSIILGLSDSIPEDYKSEFDSITSNINDLQGSILNNTVRNNIATKVNEIQTDINDYQSIIDSNQTELNNIQSQITQVEQNISQYTDVIKSDTNQSGTAKDRYDDSMTKVNEDLTSIKSTCTSILSKFTINDSSSDSDKTAHSNLQQLESLASKDVLDLNLDEVNEIKNISDIINSNIPDQYKSEFEPTYNLSTSTENGILSDYTEFQSNENSLKVAEDNLESSKETISEFNEEYTEDKVEELKDTVDKATEEANDIKNNTLNTILAGVTAGIAILAGIFSLLSSSTNSVLNKENELDDLQSKYEDQYKELIEIQNGKYPSDADIDEARKKLDATKEEIKNKKSELKEAKAKKKEATKQLKEQIASVKDQQKKAVEESINQSKDATKQALKDGENQIKGLSKSKLSLALSSLSSKVFDKLLEQTGIDELVQDASNQYNMISMKSKVSSNNLNSINKNIAKEEAKQTEMKNNISKAKSDLDSGKISQIEYDNIVRKNTYTDTDYYNTLKAKQTLLTQESKMDEEEVEKAKKNKSELKKISLEQLKQSALAEKFDRDIQTAQDKANEMAEAAKNLPAEVGLLVTANSGDIVATPVGPGSGVTAGPVNQLKTAYNMKKSISAVTSPASDINTILAQYEALIPKAKPVNNLLKLIQKPLNILPI